MAEYIEREFALNVLCRENCGHDYEANKCNNCYISNFINYLPTADVAEVKHGKWEDYGSGVCCSECGISLFHQDTNNNGGIEPSGFIYCPNCGANMDLED